MLARMSSLTLGTISTTYAVEILHANLPVNVIKHCHLGLMGRRVVAELIEAESCLVVIRVEVIRIVASQSLDP